MPDSNGCLMSFLVAKGSCLWGIALWGDGQHLFLIDWDIYIINLHSFTNRSSSEDDSKVEVVVLRGVCDDILEGRGKRRGDAL